MVEAKCIISETVEDVSSEEITTEEPESVSEAASEDSAPVTAAPTTTATTPAQEEPDTDCIHSMQDDEISSGEPKLFSDGITAQTVEGTTQFTFDAAAQVDTVVVETATNEKVDIIVTNEGQLKPQI